MRLNYNESELRIIAGKWRGRKIVFANNQDLRPTPDRVRETLFNWLALSIKDACVLDLFAGSGILSFESLSRGAKKVLAVEKNENICIYINGNIARLNALELNVVNSDAMSWLNSQSARANKTTVTTSATAAKIQFDIIFLDPPYKSNLLLDSINQVVTKNILNANGLLYFEWNSEVSATELPENLTIIKAKKAGQVYYYLARKDG